MYQARCFSRAVAALGTVIPATAQGPYGPISILPSGPTTLWPERIWFGAAFSGLTCHSTSMPCASTTGRLALSPAAGPCRASNPPNEEVDWHPPASAQIASVAPASAQPARGWLMGDSFHPTSRATRRYGHNVPVPDWDSSNCCEQYRVRSGRGMKSNGRPEPLVGKPTSYTSYATYQSPMHPKLPYLRFIRKRASSYCRRTDQEVGLGSKKVVALRPDHLLGFCHNDLFHFSLRMRADQEGGLARARTLGPSVSHNGTSWHRTAHALLRVEPCRQLPWPSRPSGLAMSLR